MTRSRLYRDPAQVGEFADPCSSTKAAVAAGLHPAEGHLRFVVNG